MRKLELFSILNTVLLAGLYVSVLLPIPSLGPYCWIGIKYVVFNDEHQGVEVVGPVWINGARDNNERAQKVLQGQTVTFTAPETIQILNRTAVFSFWQLEEPEPTFQGLIVTDRNLTVYAHGVKMTWWANYALND